MKAKKRKRRGTARAADTDLGRYSPAWRHRSVSELARKIGYHRMSLSFVFHGKRGLSVDLQQTLASEFGITRDRLMELLPKREAA